MTISGLDLLAEVRLKIEHSAVDVDINDSTSNSKICRYFVMNLILLYYP